MLQNQEKRINTNSSLSPNDYFCLIFHKVIAQYGHWDSDKAKFLYDSILSFYDGKYRESGEPYLNYCADILNKLAELNLDFATIAAGLIWNALMMDSSHKDSFKQLGDDVVDLASRVSKIQAIDYRSSENVQAEQFRHLILALARDIRVIFILLVDRAHCLKFTDDYSQFNSEKYAIEAKDIYAPLANRLGIGCLKFELEDLSFKILEKDIYEELRKKAEARRAGRERYLEQVERIVCEHLVEENLQGSIKGRIKHLSSIYKKMLVQKISFDEVYDIVGIRIITNSIRDCYSVLGIVHSLWKPIPNRFKDYLAMPKKNMYQSIHTSVIGPDACPLEVQIRTIEMDRVAEIGIAAHWRYKENQLDRKYNEKFFWLRQIMQWIQENKDPVELMEVLKVDLFPDEVYVFTPNGDVKTLPKESTILDFAFNIHSDVGLHCRGGKVNGKLVPLKTKLKTGDLVEIITSPSCHPSAGWLELIRTSNARSKIRKYLKEQNRERSIQTGKELLQKVFRKQKIWQKMIFDSAEILTVASNLGFQNVEDLLAAVGFGEISGQQVCNRITILLVKTEETESNFKVIDKSEQTPVSIDEIADIELKFARCCEPIPGEKIIGYITHGRGITIHAKRCVNILKLESERIVSAQWEAKDRVAYPARIVFKSHNQPQFLSDLNSVLTQHKAVVLSRQIESTRRKDKVKGELKIEVTNLDCLNSILQGLEKIPGMISVNRVLSR